MLPPTLEEKLQILHRLAQLFNRENITWAACASLMLYLRGRVPTFHDLDLMVDESQVLRAKALLSQIVPPLPPKPNDKYLTRHFYEFIIDNVEIDLMAGFVIVNNNIPHECPLLPEDIDTGHLHDGTPIPLHSLRAWRKCYTLMGRPEKAALCAD